MKNYDKCRARVRGVRGRVLVLTRSTNRKIVSSGAIKVSPIQGLNVNLDHGFLDYAKDN